MIATRSIAEMHARMRARQRRFVQRLRRGALCAGAAVLAAACTASPASHAPATAVAAEIELPPIAPAAPDAPADDAADATALAAAPVANSARALVGIGREALVARLGPANFVRRDGPAEVWRYRTAECYFEAFLYRDDLLGQRVAHIDARTLAGRPMPVETCFAQIAMPKQS